MKVCSICKVSKDLSEFYKKRNGLTHRCKDCEKSYQQLYYQKNRQKRIDVAKVNGIKQQQKLRQYVANYLKNNPCIDCGESNILTLQFDHLKDKHFDISVKLCSRRPIGIERLKEEISKCVVRCANCHQIKTASESGWWKLEYV
jgi:hypothetical protein